MSLTNTAGMDAGDRMPTRAEMEETPDAGLQLDLERLHRTLSSGTFGARSGGKSFQASGYKFSDETEAQYQERMRSFKLDMLAKELGRGQARIKAMQAIFRPKKLAILVAQAHGLPLLPGLLVRYDGLLHKTTFPVQLEA